MEPQRAVDGIAVIGMSCRVPGATDLDAFWDNLANGVESSTTFSQDELHETFSRLGLDLTVLERPGHVGTGYVLDDVECFDPALFGISVKEAELIDPQHRLFLECAWEALEKAGYAPGALRSRVGVFGGSALSTYLMANLYHHVDFSGPLHPLQNLIANDKDYLTTRASFLLDLKGPSVAVQTACSTSLVAVCMACDSLRDYQCDLALAGGVTIVLPQRIGYLYEEGNIFSPDGHCRPFDARAAGTVFGSGAGIVVLKRLEEALSDRDHVLAVIKDTAVNNDGIAKIAYTAPNEMAQAEVIATAQARAEVPADTITYVEAHGTGTQLGDPIEVAALNRVFRRSTRRTQFCAIGSVKSNVGHLQAAAGVTSLIKTVLALQHRMLPPSINFEAPNPAIDFEQSPFYVNTKLTPWRVDGIPRRAGVSSFGMGGTNAHVIVEEAPAPAPRSERDRRPSILVLSAKSDAALAALAGRYEAYLDSHADADAAAVCFTASVGRAHFDHRLAIVGDSGRSLRDQLGSRSNATGTVRAASPPPVAFVFADRMPEAGVDGDLYRTLPAFRAAVDECNALLGDRPARGAALFVLQYALARWWQSLGVTPRAMVGGGTRTLAADCVNGTLGLAEALARIADAGYDRVAADAAPLETRVEALESEGYAALWIPGLEGSGSHWAQLLRALSGLYERGCRIDWTALEPGAAHRRVPLPTYPFERQRCWIEPAIGKHEAAPAASSPFQERFRDVAASERRELLDAYVREQAADVVGVPADAIDPRQRLFDMGLDSMTALELRNRLQSALAKPLPATLLFDHPTLAALQAHLATELIGGESPGGDMQPGAAAPARADGEPIAIVGMGCRFPGGVASPAAYWDLLSRGGDAITEVPAYRWNIDDFYDPDPSVPDKIYTRAGGFLGPVEDFDADFFGISPREASSMDPQQRLLLETCWEAFEHAQLAPDRLFDSDTGVFLGISTLDNGMNLRFFADPAKTDAYYGTGNSMSGAAGRLSYAFGLRGPCMAVETACSSSLVAVHLASQSLRSGECRTAIAAGVNLILIPDSSVVFSRARMLAPDGRCKTFSNAADGYGRGEGCGVVILKRLSDAIANHDRIVALIRGTAVNQDGPSGGLTVPNGPAQQAVVRQALRSGGVHPREVDYVEAHGTGTALGDPIEVNALGAVFGERPREAPLVIGTVKTNIGHLEAAAGIAGLIKLALCLEHRQIPASLHFHEPNRNVPWSELPVRVCTSLVEWPANGKRRIGGVSSFGFAGTNAHVVMEEAPDLEPEPREPELPCRLLTLSAKARPALEELADRYERFLAACSESDFPRVCAGAGTGRTHFKQRLSVVASSPLDASHMLAALREGRRVPGVAISTAGSATPKIALLFTGRGLQAETRRQLHETQPVFRAAVEQCARILRGLVDEPVLENADAEPALFAVEYALAKLWESWNVRPSLLAGCGVGELVAAWRAGVFSLEEGLKLLVSRSRESAIDARTAGTGAAADLSGPSELPPLQRVAREIRYATPRLPIVSAVTGEPVGARVTAPQYWAADERGRAAAAAVNLPPIKGHRVLEVGRADVRQIFETLGELYTAGIEINWEAFHGGRRRPTVVAPTYPFQKVRHWYHAPGAHARSPEPRQPGRTKVVDLLERGATNELARLLDGSPALAGIDRGTLDRVLQSLVDGPGEQDADPLYCVEWQPRSPAAPSRASAVGAWLIFADRGGVGAALDRQLRARGQQTILVNPGDRYTPQEGELGAVVYLRDVDAPSTDDLTSETLRNPGVVDLLDVVQTLARDSSARHSHLWVVTRGAVAAGNGSSPIMVAQAPSWGLGRVIALEHPELWGGLIDLDTDASAESMAALLIDVCNNADRGEQFAFRGTECLAARLTRTAAPTAPPIPIRSDASYLIAGGLGALGLGLAKWLVERGARNLALVSRAGISDRTRERVRELEGMGARVLTVRADIVRDEDTARVFTDVLRALPPLRGIVHAAGVVENAVLLQQDRERFERVMAPKVAGAWNLHTCSAGLELDFFVLFSSMASLLGSPGQGNYAAGNAFLDALAAHRRACGQPGLSVNWGPWAEIGLVAAQGDPFRDRLKSYGVALLQPVHGFRMLHELLSESRPQVAVLPIDWIAFTRAFPTGHEPPYLRGLLRQDQASAEGAQRRGYKIDELQRAPFAERRVLLTTYLQTCVAEVLQMDSSQRPPLDQGFAEMGMDSLMALELRNRLEFALAITFSPTIVFNYSTIDALGEYLLRDVIELDGGFAPSATAAEPLREPEQELTAQDLAMLGEIRESSDEEVARLIAQEYGTHQ